VMLGRRDTYMPRAHVYQLALARAAENDRRANSMGTASLLNSGLSVTERIREADYRLKHMLKDSMEGIWPTLPVIFDAMDQLCALAQIVDNGKTLDVSSSDEGEAA
jgi:hypothetical protein